VQRFREDFATLGGLPDQLAEVCWDMAPPYVKGLAAAFSGVPVTLDRFHLVHLVSQAVDRTRRTERPDMSDGAGRPPVHVSAHAGHAERCAVGLPRRAAAAEPHPEDGSGISSQAGVPRRLLTAVACGSGQSAAVVSLGA
jgi:hypothetical protein